MPQNVLACKDILLSNLLLPTPQTFLNMLLLYDFSGAGILMSNEKEKYFFNDLVTLTPLVNNYDPVLYWIMQSLSHAPL